MTNLGRIEGIDLLRGIAIGLVMARHAFPSVRPRQRCGVPPLDPGGRGAVLPCLAGRRAAHGPSLSPDVERAYPLPTTWAVCFVVGAAARSAAGRHEVPRVAVVGSLVLLLVLSVIPLRGHVLTYLAGGPAIAAATAVLLVAASAWTRVSALSSLARLALRGIVALGTISYGAYLWNYPLTLWLRPSLGDAAGLVAVALTVVMAA